MAEWVVTCYTTTLKTVVTEKAETCPIDECDDFICQKVM